LFFALPVLALVVLDGQRSARRAVATDGAGPDRERETFSIPAFVVRTVTLAVVVGIGVAVVLLPFWIALIHYPVTQAPIPHPSRANYILSPEWGMNYFVVPYGALLLALPFVIWRGSAVRRLRPL